MSSLNPPFTSIYKPDLIIQTLFRNGRYRHHYYDSAYNSVSKISQVPSNDILNICYLRQFMLTAYPKFEYDYDMILMKFLSNHRNNYHV